MQLFELVSPRLFRPLAGPNRAFYAELLLLLWEECRHTADYSISRAEAVSRAEDYFAALAKPLSGFALYDLLALLCAGGVLFKAGKAGRSTVYEKELSRW